MMRIFVDGASSGNPGPAGAGAVLYEDSVEIARLSRYLGEMTNNEAEYRALILALEEAQRRTSGPIIVHSDSELVVRQLGGAYKTRSSHLQPLFEQVSVLLTHFSEVKIEHVPREKNREADSLACEAIEEYRTSPGSRLPAPAVIGFLSDFGELDGWVGICKGVMLDIAPEARVIDISHDTPDFDVRKGAFVLAQAVRYIHARVFVAVVDPGVGSSRPAVVVETERGPLLVGPDNSLLAPAAGELGGARRAVSIENREFLLGETSSTFHGRDVFAPVAAHLIRGVDMLKLGPEIEPAALAGMPWTACRVVDVIKEKPHITAPTIEAEVIDRDKFGTLRLNVTPTHLKQAEMRQGDLLKVAWDNQADVLPLAETFSDAAEGEPLLLVDSSGYLSIAVNRGDAARRLKLEPGQRVNISKS